MNAARWNAIWTKLSGGGSEDFAGGSAAGNGADPVRGDAPEEACEHRITFRSAWLNRDWKLLGSMNGGEPYMIFRGTSTLEPNLDYTDWAFAVVGDDYLPRFNSIAVVRNEMDVHSFASVEVAGDQRLCATQQVIPWNRNGHVPLFNSLGEHVGWDVKPPFKPRHPNPIARLLLWLYRKFPMPHKDDKFHQEKA
jgi:hypothetical protein